MRQEAATTGSCATKTLSFPITPIAPPTLALRRWDRPCRAVPCRPVPSIPRFWSWPSWAMDCSVRWRRWLLSFGFTVLARFSLSSLQPMIKVGPYRRFGTRWALGAHEPLGTRRNGPRDAAREASAFRVRLATRNSPLHLGFRLSSYIGATVSSSPAARLVPKRLESRMR